MPRGSDHLPGRFRKIYEEAHAESHRNRVELFWIVGEAEAKRLAEELGGLDLTGRERRISTQSMRHAEQQRGVEVEKRKGNLPLTAEEVTKIPEVIVNHDLAYLGEVVKGKQRIVYQKRVNGHVF
jgi:hypothetical protein